MCILHRQDIFYKTFVEALAFVVAALSLGVSTVSWSITCNA